MSKEEKLQERNYTIRSVHEVARYSNIQIGYNFFIFEAIFLTGFLWIRTGYIE
jgi:hypothetical protein